MKIESLFGMNQTEAFQGSYSGGVSVRSSGLPASWGSDVATFSAEAMQALEESRQGEPLITEGKESTALDEFQEYMTKSRSRAQHLEIDEELEELYEKVAEISAKIAKVANDKTISEEERERQIQNLNSQLQQLMSKINELEELKAEKETAELQEKSKLFGNNKQSEIA